MDTGSIVLLVALVIMAVMMLAPAKKQNEAIKRREEWRDNLKPGDKVATQSGLLAEVVEVLPEYDEIVLKSEDTVSRWRLVSVIEPPIRPDEVPADEGEKDSEDNDADDADSQEDAPQIEAGESETVESDENPSEDDDADDADADEAETEDADSNK